MNYEHDPKKLAENVAKHGVWFHEAEGFEWETAVVRVDDRRPYGETRFEATGYVGFRLYVMIFCLRDTVVRIISLRKANSREVKRYAKT
ncbi:BrnT family toxin [Azonexus hydrophilus]